MQKTLLVGVTALLAFGAAACSPSRPTATPTTAAAVTPAPAASVSATVTPRPSGQSNPPTPKGASAIPGTLYYSHASSSGLGVRRFGFGHLPETLTPAIVTEHVIRVAPDGRRVAFIDDRTEAIIVANADGSGRRTLPGTKSARMLDWSPDSTRIVYRRHISPQVNVIEMIDADGGDVRRLGGDGDFPTWSPDGGYVVFASGRDRNLWKSLTIVEVGSATTRTVPVKMADTRGRVAQVASVSPGVREVAIYTFCVGCDTDNGRDRWFQATEIVDMATGRTRDDAGLVLWTAEGRTLTRVKAGGGTVLELREAGGTVIARQAEPTGNVTLTSYVP